jgi:hypothetical protein
MFGLKRPIRTVLVPAEACNRMYNALRKLYSAIIAVRNEQDSVKKVEKTHAVFVANELVDDSYVILRYSVLKNIMFHLDKGFNAAKSDPNYLETAIDGAVKAEVLFEDSRKSEHESMRKENFLRQQSHHLRRVTTRMKKDLKGILKQRLNEVQEKQKGIMSEKEMRKKLEGFSDKQNKFLSRDELKKQMNVVQGGKREQEKGKLVKFPGGKNAEDWYKGRRTG